MAIIKNGKLNFPGSANDKFGDKKRGGKGAGGKQGPKKSHVVWDDFVEAEEPTKSRKKKEFERSSGNRMLPKNTTRDFMHKKSRFDDESANSFELAQDAERFSKLDLTEIQNRINYTFENQSLLRCALTHRSALVFEERADYERLEFLGDAVLDLGMAHLLSDSYPDASEGELSKMRAALVNTQALAVIAKDLNLGPYIRLGRGEASAGGSERPSILADVTEALFGAIYRDSNYQKAFDIISEVFSSYIDQVQPNDPKTELQEALHAAGSEPPNYLLELVEGPEHAPTFVSVVIVDGIISGRGKGNTKKASQQSAAAEALSKIKPQSIEKPKVKESLILGEGLVLVDQKG